MASEGKILKSKDKKFTEFFLENAKNSLNSAKLLFEMSTNNELQQYANFKNFNGFLWVINSSYYSMFYTARALLENEGIKIKTENSIHSIVFAAFVYHFKNRIEKEFIDDFMEAKEESAEILRKSKELVEDYFNEKEKRGRFTYELGFVAMESKARTSFERAKRFNEEIRKIIEFG